MLLQVFPPVGDTLNALADTAAQATQTPLSAPATAEMNLWEMTLNGGVIMIPIALLLLLAVYIFVERFIVIRAALKDDPSLLLHVKDYLVEGKKDGAIALCQKSDTATARMVGKGLTRIGRSSAEVQTAVENVGNIEIAKLEKGLPLLATAAGGAPMLGFLGTVVGMVKAFFDMSNAGDTVTLTVLSEGIYVAMVTTVAGLIVGVLALFAYNYLTAKIANVADRLDAHTLEFLDILNETEQK